MTDTRRNPIRRLASTIGTGIGLVVLVVIGLTVANLGSRTAAPTDAPSASVVAGIGASAGPSVSPAIDDPSATIAPAPTPMLAPSAGASDEPTFRPRPMPTPTPKPTATPRPTATPAPVPDPEPEGTMRIVTASGSFGQTLAVQGITARVDRAPVQEGSLACVSDDPDRQGWTELVSYELRMVFPNPGAASEPWFAVGSKPWNVLQFDGPLPFTSGADYIVSTCRRPGDSDKVMVEYSPSGSPIASYRWYFD